MRYGKPSIAGAMAKLKAGGCDRILVAAAVSAVRGEHHRVGARRRVRGGVTRCAARARRCASSTPYHDDPGYIKALAQSVNDYWVKNGRPDKLVLSFHGVPRRSLDLGDPYHCHCQQDRAAARRRAWPRPASSTPSRSSRASAGPSGCKPYTRPTLRRAGEATGCGASTSSAPVSSATASRRWRRSASRRRQRFCGAGGEEFHCIPCLNEQPALDRRAGRPRRSRNLQGWLDAAARRRRARDDARRGRRRWAPTARRFAARQAARAVRSGSRAGDCAAIRAFSGESRLKRIETAPYPRCSQRSNDGRESRP